MKKFRNFKTKAMLIFLVCTALLTSCGSKANTTMENAFSFAGSNSKDLYSASNDSAASYDDYAYGYSEEAVAEADTVYAESADPQTEKAQNADVSTGSIDREMLVYSCSMSVDVLDFDKASEEFKTKLNQYQGFVETENLNDGSSYSRYYYGNEEKWHTYTATVRVPSRVYEDFCAAVSELGDLRSKNASVENVSQEYSDLSTTLEIYEKKEDRYLEMLANAKDETNAVAIEDKLTDVQVEIAKLKTRMNQIKTDVAYSYVYITINEVKEYQAEPVHTDTFGERLMNTLKDAGSGFLDFLEGLLFFLIYAVPYLLVFGIIIFGIVKLIKAVKNKNKAKKEKKEMLRAEKEAAKKSESGKNDAAEEKNENSEKTE